MKHILDFVYVCCLFLSVESLIGQILPPSNLSLMWDGDKNFTFSWAPPPHSVENCEYVVTAKPKDEIFQVWDRVPGPNWSSSMVLEGGYLELSVQTLCGGNLSKEVSLTMSDPDLVKNFQCNIVPLKLTRCSWLKAPNISNLRFFYRLTDHFTSISKECPYRENSCDLQANANQLITILINGTQDGKPVRNTFQRDLRNYVKPPALKWNVTKTKNEFIVRWVPPEVKLPWTLVLNYTECTTEKTATTINTVFTLPRVPHCQYWISVKAEVDEIMNQSETPWSGKKYFAADTENTKVYAVVIIPLVLAGLTVFAFVCCRKNKENILPKIPEPRNLLSDIYNNNNDKGTVHNLCIPEEEEDTCKITLVMDPQTDKSLQ